MRATHLLRLAHTPAVDEESGGFLEGESGGLGVAEVDEDLNGGLGQDGCGWLGAGKRHTKPRKQMEA